MLSRLYERDFPVIIAFLYLDKVKRKLNGKDEWKKTQKDTFRLLLRFYYRIHYSHSVSTPSFLHIITFYLHDTTLSIQ